jgi:hypothetical protein
MTTTTKMQPRYAIVDSLTPNHGRVRMIADTREDLGLTSAELGQAGISDDCAIIRIGEDDDVGDVVTIEGRVKRYSSSLVRDMVDLLSDLDDGTGNLGTMIREALSEHPDADLADIREYDRDAREYAAEEAARDA